METPKSQLVPHNEYLGEITGVKLVHELMVGYHGSVNPRRVVLMQHFSMFGISPVLLLRIPCISQ